MEKREPSYTVGENAIWYNQYVEQYGDSLKTKTKTKTKLPYDWVIPLLGIYPKETRTEKDTCTSMFIEALITIVRTWKQPRCPLVDEWDKKAVVHIHNGILLSHLKEYIWISSNEVDETGAYYTEWRKSERKTPIQYTNAYIWNLER